jgi:predicted DNA-binding transcriptional regulator YafY
MATNETQRVLYLIQRFNNNEKICIDKIIREAQIDAEDHIPNIWLNSNNSPVSERTIGRTLKVIKEYFPDSFELIRGAKGEKGCYKAVTKKAFDNFMQPEILSLMALTFSMASRSDLFDNFNINEDDKKLLSKELKDINKVYDFKNKPFETTKTDTKILKTLEHAIKYHKYIIVKYPISGKLTKIEIKPYKIIFINENFYLAYEVDREEYMFSMFRISKIKTIEETAKTYHINREISNFIQDIQTPFSQYIPDYKRFLIDVEVEVDSKKAYFFKAKKYLKSQEILKEKENGNLIINFKVTQEREVETLIKGWLPYLKVLTPISLKNKIENELKQYLS